MKTLVFMSDNRPVTGEFITADYNSLAAVINYAYCKKHGYDFIYHQTYYKKMDNPLSLLTCVDLSGNPRHASWAKLVSAMALANESYELIVYIDSDCIFKDQAKSIETYISICKEREIVFLTNFMNGHSNGIPLPCAGFFAFKNNDRIREFLKGWYEMDLKERNTELYWEQDALWLFMYGLPARLDFLKELYDFKIPNRKLNSAVAVIDDPMFTEVDGQYLIHVTHIVNHHRIPYFRNFILERGFDYGNLAAEILDGRFVQLDTSKYY